MDYGRQRTRFPASGRRKTSYDSLLHAFTKRTAPEKFRKRSTLRFYRLGHKETSDFREATIVALRTARNVRKTVAVRSANTAAYMSEA